MATGLTYRILEGATFEQFMLIATLGNKAEGLRADDPRLLELVELEYGPDASYIQSIRHAEAEQKDLLTWWKERWVREYRKYVVSRANEWDIAKRKREESREKYVAILTQLQGWEAPPSKRIGNQDYDVKAGLIKEIEESIAVDCSSGMGELSPPEEFEVWKKGQIEFSAECVERSRKRLEEEKEAVGERNRWKFKLIESLRKIRKVPVVKGYDPTTKSATLAI